MWKQPLIVPLLAWVLWMDQTAYTTPGAADDSAPRQYETAPSRSAQLAVTNTRGECESLRQARLKEARATDATEGQGKGQGPKYRDEFRYFCSPAVDDLRK
jgi:hypothetical protein